MINKGCGEMNGLLYIDKPKNCTSRDVVNQICKIFHMKKVGHTGTLDPLATGVMVVALGEGTKLISELTTHEKEYVATVKLGVFTDTLDITGTILKTCPVPHYEKEYLEKILDSFLGEIEQEVPLYSAVKVNGRRLYDYARNHEEVVLPKRMVKIEKIELLNYCEDTFTFSVKVSKGTYIRSLIRDIGEKLGTCCTMQELRRTMLGAVSIEQCVSLENITEDIKLVPISEALQCYPSYVIPNELLKRVQNGGWIQNLGFDTKVRIYDSNQHILALYQVDQLDQTKLKPDVMFHGEVI